MKLYTEEQVRNIFKEAQHERDYGIPLYFTLEDLLVNNNITPIELPSDEEIKKGANWLIGIENLAFIEGAKWMREQIQKQIQKQLLTDIMEADEKDGLYNDDKNTP